MAGCKASRLSHLAGVLGSARCQGLPDAWQGQGGPPAASSMQLQCALAPRQQACRALLPCHPGCTVGRSSQPQPACSVRRSTISFPFFKEHSAGLTLKVGNLALREAAAGEAHWVAASAPLRRLHIKPHQAIDCRESRGSSCHLPSTAYRHAGEQAGVAGCAVPQEGAGCGRLAATQDLRAPRRAALGASCFVGRCQGGPGNQPVTARPMREGVWVRLKRSACPASVALGHTRRGLPWLLRSNSRERGCGAPAR